MATSGQLIGRAGLIQALGLAMTYVTVNELELLSFFEVEPQRADQDIPWPYNEYSYDLEIGQYAVTFRLAPAYKDLSLSLSHRGETIYTFRGMAIQDVRYHKDADFETLEIVVSDRDTIWFRLRPAPVVTQDVGEA